MVTSLADQLFQEAPKPLAEQLVISQPDAINYPKNEYSDIIKSASDEYEVPYNIMYKMAETESSFNPKALGPMTKYGQAKGLYQYIDSTAKAQDIIQFDPKSSARGAAKEWKKNYNRYIEAGYDEDTSQRMATAAHNAGAGAVRKYKGVPPFPETEDYVRKIHGEKIDIISKPEMGLADQLYAKDKPDPIVNLSTDPQVPKSPMSANQLYDEYTKTNKLFNLDPNDNTGIVPFAKEVGKQIIGTAELAMSVATGMALFFPSKIYGTMALPFGRAVADMAEEGIASYGYQPFTERGRQAAEWVGKGFEIFLTPAKMAGESTKALMDKAGIPYSEEAEYLVNFGAEIAEFTLTGGIYKGTKAKFKPTLEQAKKLFKAKRDLDINSVVERNRSIEGIPDEAVKLAQRKVLEVEATQASLKYADDLKKYTEDIMIQDEIGRMNEGVVKEKMRPVQDSGLKKPVKEVVGEKLIDTPESLGKEFGVRFNKSKDGLDMYSQDVVINGEKTFTSFLVKSGDKEALAKTVAENVEKFKQSRPDKIRTVEEILADQVKTDKKINDLEAEVDNKIIELRAGKNKFKKGDKVIAYGEGIPEARFDMFDKEGFWDEAGVYPEKIKQWVEEAC